MTEIYIIEGGQKDVSLREGPHKKVITIHFNWKVYIIVHIKDYVHFQRNKVTEQYVILTAKFSH